ncbi:hypothetical protein GNE08_26675 (plasmid) [Trichormus variabilis ARAD]|uniref:Uncharacterized protein n=1 Tax=Trichormus variabilis N2B TaxID=2681315 RepID=A0ABR6SGN4_ANAVA|nr:MULTISPECIES: hypothetical protein [Nostocaceae]MBC1217784.1 hypothetical protein [Trichormus variabilis ARAD]MBC1259064.1 hypothetical protein [Trichormus variabilis V5]MBC1270723.1 hypothetical protein [Trichormus variabilis FSR]MBC1305572.1 hypothetical protein [Trichormus variabilis N2B]MBC1314631.1 hypothetical protein [Trichormus variabilis PNB]
MHYSNQGQRNSEPPAPERNQGFANQSKEHVFQQTNNQQPPGQAAGSLKLVMLKPPEMIPMTRQV